jgi:hypothetical protein
VRAVAIIYLVIISCMALIFRFVEKRIQIA